MRDDPEVMENVSGTDSDDDSDLSMEAEREHRELSTGTDDFVGHAYNYGICTIKYFLLFRGCFLYIPFMFVERWREEV